MPAKQIVHTPWGDMTLTQAARRSGLPSRLIAQRINDLSWTGYDAVTVPSGGERKYWRRNRCFRLDGDRLHWEENAQPGDIPPYEACPENDYLRYKRNCRATSGEEPLSMEKWLEKRLFASAGE